jgi:outer membrane protein OmpA-like peptidoglycan-associated protein
MRFYIFFLVSFFLLVSSFSYSQDPRVKIAEEHFKAKEYLDASVLYEQLIDEKKIHPNVYPEINRKAIEALIRTNKYKKAKEVLEVLSKTDKYLFEDAYKYALICLYITDIETAVKVVESPLFTESIDPKATKLTEYIQKIADQKSDYNFDYHYFESVYNGFAIDYYLNAPKTLKKASIYETPWYELTNLFVTHFVYDPIKDKNIKNQKLKIGKHNGAAFYDSINGGVWYYAKVTDPKKSPMSSGLFMYDEKSKKEEGYVYNRADHFLGHPSLSESREVLWFTSNREGGFGGLDIWFSIKDQTGWGEPINAGPTVNTPKDEMFPFEFNNSLYFASNGYGELEGLNLYAADLNGSESFGEINKRNPIFPKQENLATLIDSPFSSSKGFSSIQNHYLADYNYYLENGNKKRYTIPSLEEQNIVLKERVKLETTIVDKETGKKIDAAPVQIVDISPKQEIKKETQTLASVISNKGKESIDTLKLFVENRDTTIVSNEGGKIETELARDKEYVVTLSKEGYDPVMTTVKTNENINEITEKVAMRKTPDAPMIRMENVLYNLNQFNLSETGKAELDTLILFLNENKEVKIEIKSHTDCRGSDAYNLKLSGFRGKSCADYLIAGGINKSRMKLINMGETKLLNHCDDGVECSEDLHQVNRRTEFVLIFPKE